MGDEAGVAEFVGPETAQYRLRGKLVLPGLIDAHVHVGNIEVVHDRTVALPPAVYVRRATRNLETDTDLGFTTLRDAGGMDWGFRAAINQGLIRGPRLLLSVNILIALPILLLPTWSL